MEDQKSSEWKWAALVSGLFAGCATAVSLHPLELLKTRLQVNEHRSRNYLISTIQTIWQKEGVAGFYRGVTPNALGSTTAWGLYFQCYTYMKQKFPVSSTSTENMKTHLLSAATAGTITTTITNPLWVIKTRMALQDNSEGRVYRNIFDAFRKITRDEGFSGFFKGLAPGLFGVVHGCIQFLAYEYLRDWREKTSGQLQNSDFLILGASSKFLAGIATYPHQVVRTRLQQKKEHSPYRRTLQTIQLIFKTEGLLGFYNGLVPYLARVLPASALTFFFFENAMNKLK